MANRSGRPAKGDELNSKEKIIDTTVSIIKKKGADAVTVRDVCKEAGLSIGTFYHYFRDKDDLMISLFDTFLDFLQKRTAKINCCLNGFQQVTLIDFCFLIHDVFEGSFFHQNLNTQIIQIDLADADPV